ncbi:MAG: MazG family protein [Actinomycetes bacterium]
MGEAPEELGPSGRRGRLVLLATTHRVPAGVLTWPAWQVLRSGRVLAGSAQHALAPHLSEAGVGVEAVGAEGAAALARHLLDAATGAADDRPVVWLGAPDGDPGLAERLAVAVADDAGLGRAVPEVEVLHGSYDLPGARLLDLVAVMDRLRSPGGCPWDARQTHATLLRYLLEETYETVEAVETGDRGHLREELGDLLLQVMFHARIAEEHPEEPFSVDEVAGDIVDKLVRRHPHVFAGVEVSDADEVSATWETLKAAEKGRTSAVEGVPMAQPALALAAKLLSRVEATGLDLPVVQPGPDLSEPPDEQALGDVLMALVAGSRRRDLDPERALREAARRYAARVRAAEQS